MDFNLGQFKNVFLLDSLYGTTTVSLDTLEQSKWKVAYSVALIAVYLLEIIVYLYTDSTNDTLEPAMIKTFRFIVIGLPLYSLVSSVLDYKSRISAALNLEAIEEKLESNNIKVPKKNLWKSLQSGLLLMTVVTQTLGVVFIAPKKQLPISKYLTTFLYIGTQLLQYFALVLFLTKIVIIQRAITDGFAEVRQEQQRPLTSHDQRPRNRRRRAVTLKDEMENKWALLAELEGSLQFTEQTIRNSFWVHVAYYRISLEVVTPLLCTFWLDQGGLNSETLFFCVRTVLPLVSIVYAWEMVKREKKTSFLRITDGTENGGVVSAGSMKRQILAKIHRSRAPFSCAFFEVDYALLVTVLENFLFVTTAALGLGTS